MSDIEIEETESKHFEGIRIERDGETIYELKQRKGVDLESLAEDLFGPDAVSQIMNADPDGDSLFENILSIGERLDPNE